MIASAIIPVLPNDSIPDSSQAEIPAPSQAPLADFGSLLLLFSAQPVAPAQFTDDGGDLAEPEAAAPPDDATAAVSALQLVLTPALLSLYDQPKQIAATQAGAADDFSHALDLSPIYFPDHAIAQALPFEGRLAEEPVEAPTNSDAKEKTQDAPGFSSQLILSSPPEQQSKSGQEALPAFPPAPEQGIAPDKAQQDKAVAEKLVFTREAAQPPASAQIFSAAQETAALDPGRAGNPAEKNYRQEKKNGSEGQAPSTAPGRLGTALPHDPESLVPPAPAAADVRVAAQVEGAAIASGAHDEVSETKNEIPARAADAIGANAQATALVHERVPHGVERERPAEARPANAFASVIERVAAEISTHSRQGQHEITMRLEPPELGNLKIELLLDGDRLQARVTAEGADAGNLIQTHLPELRQALQAHNLDLVNVQVDLGGRNGLGAGGLAQDSGRDSGGRGDAAAPPSLAQGIEGEIQEPTTAVSPSTGAVSVWA
jgi:flagellar hook-length control protein FliK